MDIIRITTVCKSTGNMHFTVLFTASVFLLMCPGSRGLSGSVGGSDDPSCPGPCECTVSQGLVNCSYQGLKDITFQIPRYVRELDLSNNALFKIPPNVFSGLPSLSKLLLFGNKLSTHSIVNGSFSGINSLDTLDLSYNHFQSVPSDLPGNITYFYFMQNQVANLDSLGSGLKYVYHLDLSNNHISTVHRDLFADVSSIVVLYMSFNSISAETFPPGLLLPLTKLQIFEIRFNPLGEVPAYLPASLVGLDLVGIQLQKISKGPFNHLKQLDNLAFWQNSITEIEDGAFIGLEKMTLLDSQSNKIKVITNATFQGLPSMKTLYLEENEIGHIHRGAFNWFKQPQEIWLGDNRLSTLDSSFEMIFNSSSLSFVDLSFNPWNCDCHLRWLKLLSEKSSKISFPHLIKCSSPPALRGKSWDVISSANFTCSP